MGLPPGVVPNLEHPTDVLRTVNLVTQSLTIAFVTVFVAIRGVSKYRQVGLDFTIDDYLTFTSWILMVGYCVCGIFLSVYGGGYHIWDVPPQNITKFFQVAYAATIFYAPMALFVKLSLLTMIARIFSPYKKTVIGIYSLDGMLIIYYVAALIIKIRICWPISAYWKGDESKCLPQQAVITADSIISVVSDVIILVLPLPLTWSLQLPRNKKLRVAGMLCVGGLATAFSAWRLHLIVTDGGSPDLTIVFVKVVLSGNAEAGIGLICTCLPAVAALIHKVKEHTGYGSSDRYGGRNDMSGSYKLSHLSSSRATKDRPFKVLEAGSDEAGLVTHAQRQHGSPYADTAHDGGIMRQVEVSTSVSYMNSDDENRTIPGRG